MKTKSTYKISLIGLASVFIFSLSWAVGSGRTLVLDPTPKHPDASGTTYISDDPSYPASISYRINITMFFVDSRNSIG